LPCLLIVGDDALFISFFGRRLCRDGLCKSTAALKNGNDRLHLKKSREVWHSRLSAAVISWGQLLSPMVLSRDGFVMGSVVRFVLFPVSFIVHLLAVAVACGLWPVAMVLKYGVGAKGP
jgi:hypothetical protein